MVFAFDNVFIGNKKRNVLVEHFTNANANGEDANQYLYDIFDEQLKFDGELIQDTTDFVALQYHLGVPFVDLLHEDNIEDSGARALFYGFSEAPRSIMDGLPDFSGNTHNINAVNIDSLSLKDPLFTIKLDTIASNRNEIHVKTVLTANQEFEEQLILHVGIIENRIVLGSNTYRYVLKKLLYGGSGLVITEIWDAGSQARDYIVSWRINIEIYDATQVGIVAFVQNKVTKEVYQADYLKAMYKEKRSITGISKEWSNVVKAMKIYPNPVQDELTIIHTADQSENYYWEIVDQTGMKILSGNRSSSQERYKINTSTTPNGVYYLVIGGRSKPIAYHKIVVAHIR